MTTITIKIIDNRGDKVIKSSNLTVGMFNGKIAQFSIKRVYNEHEDRTDETILIKYGHIKDFVICSIYPAPLEGYVFVSGFLYGNMGDIMLSGVDWLNVLKRLGSVQVKEQWEKKLAEVKH